MSQQKMNFFAETAMNEIMNKVKEAIKNGGKGQEIMEVIMDLLVQFGVPLPKREAKPIRETPQDAGTPRAAASPAPQSGHFRMEFPAKRN